MPGAGSNSRGPTARAGRKGIVGEHIREAAEGLLDRRRVTEGIRTSTEELFFDLVFVYAFIQVTALMTADLTARGVLDGLLILALLRWSWSCFAWLGNNVQASFGITRFGLIAVTPITLVMAAATREAFDADPGD